MQLIFINSSRSPRVGSGRVIPKHLFFASLLPDIRTVFKICQFPFHQTWFSFTRYFQTLIFCFRAFRLGVLPYHPHTKTSSWRYSLCFPLYILQSNYCRIHERQTILTFSLAGMSPLIEKRHVLCFKKESWKIQREMNRYWAINSTVTSRVATNPGTEASIVTMSRLNFAQPCAICPVPETQPTATPQTIRADWATVEYEVMLGPCSRLAAAPAYFPTFSSFLTFPRVGKCHFPTSCLATTAETLRFFKPITPIFMTQVLRALRDDAKAIDRLL